MRALVAKRVARGRVELSLSLQLRQTPGVEVEFNEEFGRALEVALDQARERGLVAGALTPGDLLRLPQALTIRERQPDDDEAAQAERGGAGARRGRRRRWSTSTRCERAKAITCAPISTAAGPSVADLVERIAVAADEGRAAMEQRLAERVRELRDRAAGRRDRGRAGDRADGGAVRHQRRGRALPRPRRRTGWRSPTARSRAAASSISCCRR